MYMKKKPFDHIDNQFREAAENFQPPVTPEAWEKMEVLLDKSGRKPRPVLWFWPLLIILLTGGAGVYFFKESPQTRPAVSAEHNMVMNQNPNTKETATGPVAKKEGTANPGKTDPAIAQLQAPIVNKDASNKEPDLIADKLSGDKESATTKASASPGSNTQLQRGSPGIHSGANRTSTTAENLKPTANKTRASKQGKGKDKQNSLAQNQHKSETKLADGKGKETLAAAPVADDAVTGADKTADQVAPVQDKPVTPPATADAGKTNDVKKEENPVKPEENTVKDRKSETKKIPAGFYYMVTLAAEGNGLKPFAFDQGAVRYGIGIGYQLNRRWSIQSGFLASRKDYQAGDDDYYFKPGSYYDTVDMKSIDAACYVMQIPVSIRYNIIQKNTSSFYTVAGLSSYIMKKEVYDYYYTYHNTWPASPKVARHTYTGNKHFFSVLDLSLGYERSISPTISLQAEPYMNIPLAGVGEGKVSLYSAGLQLAFKWQRMKTIKAGSR